MTESLVFRDRFKDFALKFPEITHPFNFPRVLHLGVRGMSLRLPNSLPLTEPLRHVTATAEAGFKGVYPQLAPLNMSLRLFKGLRGMSLRLPRTV